MTALFLARPGGVSRGLAVGIAGVTVASVLALAVISATNGSDEQRTDAATEATTEARQGAMESFEAALAPLIEEGGFVVAMGMRPGIADIAEGAYDDVTLVTMAEGWRTSMEGLRGRFAALPVPGFLAEFSRRFDAALEAYIEVAVALGDAARTSGDERARLVDAAAERGESADNLYDEAMAELDQWRSLLRVPIQAGRPG